MNLTPEGVYEETKRILREQSVIRDAIRRKQAKEAAQREIYELQRDRLAQAWAAERRLYDPRPRRQRHAMHPATQAA